MKKKIYRFIALFTAINLLVETFVPAVSYALTSGPSQPEHVQFAPVGANNTVDLFSGDFSYNIPLFELPGPDGGYPFNLTYQAGVSVEEEASWVGLGWNLTPGAINRQMRGLPDEFKGDQIIQKIDRKPNTTFSLTQGVGVDAALEFFGIEEDKTRKIIQAVQEDGNAPVRANLGLSLSFTYTENNYTGIGYSFGGGFSGGLSAVGFNLGKSTSITLDSESGYTSTNGNSIDFTLPLQRGSYKEGGVTLFQANSNARIGFSNSKSRNSRQGLLSTTHSISVSASKQRYSKSIDGQKESGHFGGGLSAHWTTDYVNNGYMPSITTPTIAQNTSFLMKGGGHIKGLLSGSLNYSGSTSQQLINYTDKENKIISTPAYGYNNSDRQDHDKVQKGLMDINRERDRVIHKETKTLPTPNFMYDTYMVTGQGLSGMFRPYRGEVGVLGDNYVQSITRGGSAGVDLAFPIGGDIQVGLNFEIISGSSESDSKTSIGRYKFRNKATSKLHEPLYYKFQGEASIKPLNSLNKIGNHLPIRFEIDNYGQPKGDEIIYSQVESDITREGTSLEDVSGATQTSSVTDVKKAQLDPYFNAGRDSRNTLIQEVKNSEVEYYPEYTIDYRNEESELIRFIRANEQHHLAGFTCTNPSGMRYVYGLPAYNHKQVERVRSIKNNNTIGDQSHSSKVMVDEMVFLSDIRNEGAAGTEEYINETTTPKYPYAYLLTSILGTDYIDVDYNESNGRGITPNDLGYWVKFSYNLTNKGYKWKSPYDGVNFTEGLRSSNADDKVSRASGEKEIWYLDKAETKSHIAIFHTLERQDAKSTSEQKQRFLDKISLYTRHEYESHDDIALAKPIKEIHFAYDYELCPNTPNSDAVSKGKLTLKKIWFTYQGVTRGELNPYEFTYYNAPYTESSMDRWGVFEPRVDVDNHQTHASYPYVKQDLDLTTRTNNVSAWNLKEIKMPTGSIMRIKYESDDYAYVQDRQAMQMYKFSIGSVPFSPISDDSKNKEKIKDSELKMYFRLQDKDIQQAQNIIGNTSTLDATQQEQLAEIVNTYLDERDQVYVKTVIGLRKNDDFEDLSAYLDIEPTRLPMSEDEPPVFTRGITMDGFYGYFTLKPALDKSNQAFHPLSVSSWIKLLTEFPRLINPHNKMDEFEGLSKWKDINKFLSAFRALKERRANYYDMASDEEWGRTIYHDYSYVRLNNVMGQKYGGGHRVKSIEFWDGTGSYFNDQSTYGQIYDYTTTENGKLISSGVASYEPLTGGDENALRYAEKYIKEIRGNSKYAMGMTGYEFYVEYPVNEGYYPGAKVGYSKVTVKSLATAKKIEALAGNNQNTPLRNASTTGVTVQEFYTTKDFPTLAAQTDIDHVENRRESYTFFPTGGRVTLHTGMCQGFVVELNNMNGQAKAMYHYGQNDNGDVLYDKPISSSEYFYKTVQRGKNKVLDNKCEVLVADKNGNIKKEDVLVGVEYDVFIDSRRSVNKLTRGGANFNLFMSKEPPYTFPTLFPSGYTTREEVNITVINKIIYRSGILDYVKVTDGLSTSTTQNLLWDANTGGVLLTSVNNNFDDKIYSYTIPAYTQYDEMGAAYRNIGLTFDLATNYTTSGGRIYNLEALIPKAKNSKGEYPLWTSELVEGDELIVRFESEPEGKNLYRAIYMGAHKEDQKFRFFIVPSIDQDQNSTPQGSATFTIVRSGRRNLLAASAGNITALVDPTEARSSKTLPGKSTITKKK